MSEQKKSQDQPPIKLNTQNMRPALRKGTEDNSLLAVTSTNSLRPPELNRPIVIPTPAKRTFTSTLLLNEPTKDIPSGCFTFMSWMVLQLNVVDSEESIRISPIEGKLLHIGRNPESAPKTVDIDLTSHVSDVDGVSRIHAAIKLVGTRLELHDMNSTNGTSINGIRFNPNESHPLRSDDIIMLGKFQLAVRFTPRLESTNKHDTNILSPIE
jgi:hypothetical protein